MFAALDETVAPLVESGWRITENHTDSYTEGQSVGYMLQRGREEIEVELCDNGAVVAFPGGDGDFPRDEDGNTIPLFDVDSPDELMSEFSSRGWLAQRE